MKSRDFVIWIDGFIQGKINLSVDDIRHIKNKVEEVDLRSLLIVLHYRLPL